MKKLFIFVLVITLSLCALCFGAAADDVPEQIGGVYQISNAEQLYWFAELVNSGVTDANAVLTADITINENVLNDDGTLNEQRADSLRQWTPIGTEYEKSYSGTFDGQGHTISGLYYSSNDSYYSGLFGHIENLGTVKNLNVADSYISSNAICVGGICGATDEGLITNCSFGGFVSGGEQVGGICGSIDAGFITNCSFSGSVSGGKAVGGVCGFAGRTRLPGKILNCFSSGSVSGGEKVGGVCGYNRGAITNCFSSGSVSGDDEVGGVCGDNGDTITNCYWLEGAAGGGIGGGSGTATAVDAKTDEEFASGEVTLLLNAANGPWRQTLDEDEYPVLDGTHDVIHYENGEYKNSLHTFDDNGFCTNTSCIAYESPAEVDGVYQISNAGQLYWFAQYVNVGNAYAGAVLTEDITLNENVLNDDGTLNAQRADSFRQWTPIGISSCNFDLYLGSFDGQGHTISGLYYNGNGAGLSGKIGLFGGVGTLGSDVAGQVSNVNVIDSYISISDGAHASVGGLFSTLNGVAENCSFSGFVSGDDEVGGVCGYNSGAITNCFSSGSVNGTDEVGGVCGINHCGKISNCFSSASVSGDNEVGGVCGDNGDTITNCYWLKGAAETGIGTGSGTATAVDAKTAEEFASGEVTYLLNGESGGPWRQNLSGLKDDIPTLDSAHKEVVKLTIDGNIGYFNKNDEFTGEPGKAYFKGGERITLPYKVETDTTLTSENLVRVTAVIEGSVTKSYDGNTDVPSGHDLSIKLTGIEDGDDVTATATYAFTDPNAGEDKTVKATYITLGGKDAVDYYLSSTTVTGTAGTITPKTVTITAEDKTAERGGTMPELTYKTDGFIGSDTFDKEPELSCNTDMTVAGKFTITVTGGAASSNYTLERKNGILTVANRWLVTVKPGNGSADESSYLKPGDSFPLPAAPSKPGYIFMGWTDGENTRQPGDKVDITSDTTFRAVWANMPDITPDEPDEFPFTDVTEDDWFYDAVYYVWENGLMNGTEADEFAPNSPLTRAMVWAVLARIDGVEVSGDNWMTVAQKWAVNSGVSDGTNPTGYITREQLVTMLWRYKGSPAVEYTLTAPDAASISDWAVDAMKWAASTGLIEGDETGALNPASNSTRAHAATFFMRYLEK